MLAREVDARGGGGGVRDVDGVGGHVAERTGAVGFEGVAGVVQEERGHDVYRVGEANNVI